METKHGIHENGKKKTLVLNDLHLFIFFNSTYIKGVKKKQENAKPSPLNR